MFPVWFEVIGPGPEAAMCDPISFFATFLAAEAVVFDTLFFVGMRKFMVDLVVHVRSGGKERRRVASTVSACYCIPTKESFNDWSGWEAQKSLRIGVRGLAKLTCEHASDGMHACKNVMGMWTVQARNTGYNLPVYSGVYVRSIIRQF